MTIVDIVIIAIIALCGLIGLAKGLFKSLVSFLGWMLSLLLAFFLTTTIAYALLDVGAIGGFVIGKAGGGFSLFGWVQGWMPAVSEAPSFITGLMAPIIQKIQIATTGGTFATVEQGLSLMVSYYIFCAMVFAALFIVTRIIMSLVILFVRSFEKEGKKGAVSRLLGFVAGAAKGVMYVAVLFLIMGYALAIPQLSFLSDEVEKSVIGKPVQEQIIKLSDKFLTKTDEETYNKLIAMAGFEPASETPEETGEEETGGEETGGEETGGEETGGEETGGEETGGEETGGEETGGEE